MKRYFWSYWFLLFILATSNSAFAQGSAASVNLSSDQGFELDLDLEPGAVYEIQLSMRPVTGPGEVTLRAESSDLEGVLLEFRQTDRGLISPNDWQVISVQLPVPTAAANSRLFVRASQAGEYEWQDLSIRRVRMTAEDVQAFWADKLAAYPTVYTGLVIDARHLRANRSMSPRILSESGQLIYGGVFADMEFIQETGVAAFGSVLEPPVALRAAAHPSYPLMLPLTIEAVAVADPAGTHFIVRDEDAQRIFAALAAYDFLASYAVVILIP